MSMLEKKHISHTFLLGLMVLVFYLVYLFFKPFLMDIVIAGVLVSIFYGLYERILKLFRGRQSLAALLMVVIIALIIILPITEFLFYFSQKSLEGFSAITAWVNSGALAQVVNNNFLSNSHWLRLSDIDLRNYLVSISSQIYTFLVTGGKFVLKSTTDFLTSIIIIFFTMFFLFRDGKKMMQRIMHLTPLPQKYDIKLFQKFRDVSYSAIVSTFITSIVQGLVGAVGFLIVGIPAFFPGVLMALLALLPYVGSAAVWLPAGIYLLVIGKLWQGIFLLAWGFGVVSVIDNILRPYLIKGRAQVHPLIIFFSIFGGIITFGFGGLIVGPVIVALFFTLLHIYELEYAEILD